MGQFLSYENFEADTREPSDEVLQAIKQGDVKRLQSYCREHDLDSLFGGKPLLHHAVYHRQLECVKFLLARGADSNSSSSSGCTPVFEIFSSHTKRKFREAHDISMIETLLKAKADINARNSAQRTPLLKSIIDNENHITECLLAHNAEVNNIGDVDGLLPIHISATYSSLQLLRRLINCGADINGQDVRGRTALHYSILSEHKQVFEELIAMGCDVNIYSDLGCPLQVAVVCCQRDMVQILLETGAFVSCAVTAVQDYHYILRIATDILEMSLAILLIKLTELMWCNAPLKAMRENALLSAINVVDLIIQAHGSNDVELIRRTTRVYDVLCYCTLISCRSEHSWIVYRIVYKLETIYHKLGFLISMFCVRLYPQSAFLKSFERHHSKLLTLQNLCRMRVRELVMRSRTNVIDAVKTLDCSVVIKDILLLKDQRLSGKIVQFSSEGNGYLILRD